MSAQPQVVPMMLEIDDLEVDDEFEGRDAETLDDEKKGLVGFLKSPIGMIAIGVTVLLLGGAGFLFGSGAIDGFGKPKLNSSAEDSLALSSGPDVLDQVDMNLETEEVASGGDARISGEGAHGGADRRELLEEVSAPSYGDISYTDTGAIYHTSPTTVSVKVDGVTRELTLSLGIMGDRETARLLKEEGLTVNVLTIEAAQSVDFGPFLDWEIPGLITKDLRTRLVEQFPDANIRAIMIRDFQF